MAGPRARWCAWPMHKRVSALDAHPTENTACAVEGHADGCVQVTQRDFGAFQLDRRALAQGSLEIRPEVFIMPTLGCLNTQRHPSHAGGSRHQR
jgi:hypothetical protein